jgi:hydrogenase small subunit
MMRELALTRRELLKLGGLLAAGAALPAGAAEIFAGGARKLLTTTRIVWIQAQSCTGDSVSLLNTADPEPVELLTRFVSLVAHQTIGAAQGQTFMDLLDKAREQGDYILVIEGSLPLNMPEACTIGGRTIEELLLKLVPAAKAVVAVGTCAAFGGVPAAEGNQTGAGSVLQFMTQHQLPHKGKLINCPSCPTHPKCLVGTLAYVAAKGYPQVDPNLLTPTMFYGHSTHDECPRYHYYERKIFAKYLGDSNGCLFELGCLGPISYTECPHRQWNGGVNWCVRASAPCIGCSSPHFTKRRDFPFYRKGEHQHAVSYSEQDRKGGN